MSGVDKIIAIHSNAPSYKKAYMDAVRAFVEAEQGGAPSAEVDVALSKAHEAACAYFNFFETISGYSESVWTSDVWRRQLAEDCNEILNSLLNHQRFIKEAAERNNVDGSRFVPGKSAYKRMIALVSRHLPTEASELTKKFAESGLKAPGADTQKEPQSLWSRLKSATRDPLSILPAAIQAVPAVKYAVGVLGVAGCAAVALGYFKDPKIALVGTIAGIGLMGLLFLFSQAATLKSSSIRIPALLFVWCCLVLFVVWAGGMTTSVFVGWPLHIEFFGSPGKAESAGRADSAAAAELRDVDQSGSLAAPSWVPVPSADRRVRGEWASSDGQRLNVSINEVQMFRYVLTGVGRSRTERGTLQVGEGWLLRFPDGGDRHVCTTAEWRVSKNEPTNLRLGEEMASTDPGSANEACPLGGPWKSFFSIMDTSKK